ncbi:MAG: hypothetical protein SFY81_15080 [Verrucomicrobiota bacterium]|nr:hypothetical protein [Verrucomicrobiota bacterium]
MSGFRYLKVLLLSAVGILTHGATLVELFQQFPGTNQWGSYGDKSLFGWNTNSGKLEVTWDSRKPNSYFHIPLQTVITRSNDFSLKFALTIHSMEIGVDPAKPNTFQIAIGFIQWANATRTNFYRGTGVNALQGPRSIVEFSYFPDSGFGETFAPTIASSDNQIVFSDNHPLPWTLEDLFEIQMSFDSGTQTLRTTVLRNGEPYSLDGETALKPLVYPGHFADFQADTFAIASYSDSGQDPRFAGSILAQGSIDDIEINLPEPALKDIQVEFQNGKWRVFFLSKTEYVYHLERSSNLLEWSEISRKNGSGSILSIEDAEGGNAAFYRVRATLQMP